MITEIHFEIGKELKVIITILGGMAYVEKCPENVEVIINDLD